MKIYEAFRPRHPLDPALLKTLQLLFATFFFMGISGFIAWKTGAATREVGNFTTQDFVQCWSASRFALMGNPEFAYDLQRLTDDARAQIYPTIIAHAWLYPPVGFLLYWPWGLLPYTISWVLFSTLTSAAFTWMVHKIIPIPKVTLWAILASTTFQLNFWMGQNGALNAVIIGGFLLCMRSRPIIAGICLGALAYKPHFAPMLGLVLLLDRQWLSLAVAAATTAMLVLASILFFGTHPWELWLSLLDIKQSNFANNIVYFQGMASMFSFAKSHEFAASLCWALHGMVFLPALYMTLRVWLAKEVHQDLKSAALVFSVLLLTPYVYFYDYVIALVGMAFWLRYLMAGHWNNRTYYWIVFLWFLPMWHSISGKVPALPIAPFAMLISIYLIYRAALEQHTKPALS